MAVSSMTGFGSAERSWTLDDPSAPPRRLTAEIRSVNARFLELKIRQPFGPAVEATIRRQLEAQLGRGRVEVRITVEMAAVSGVAGDGARGGEGDAAVALAQFGVDPQRVHAVARALAEVRRIASEYLEVEAVKPMEILSFASGAPAGSDLVAAPPGWLGSLVDEAVAGLLSMRRQEGEALATILAGHLEGLSRSREVLASTAAAEPGRLMATVRDRLDALLASDEVGVQPEPERVAAEVALLLSRGDVSEELDRIESHLVQAREVLREPAARGQGKTLDFLAQELLREFTTTGSKLAHADASARVIEAKGILERLREQVQNVE